MWRVINSNTSQTSFWKFAGVSSTTSVPAYMARRGLARPCIEEFIEVLIKRLALQEQDSFKMVIMNELTRNTRYGRAIVRNSTLQMSTSLQSNKLLN